jgi:hypothetical protein
MIFLPFIINAVKKKRAQGGGKTKRAKRTRREKRSRRKRK